MVGGRANVDLVAETGGKVSISGPGAVEGMAVTVTIKAYDAEPPFRARARGIQYPSYYDVKIEGIPDGSASVCLTSTSGKDPTVMRYLKNNAWLDAGNLKPSGRTITGEIRVSDLFGSPIIIGT